MRGLNLVIWIVFVQLVGWMAVRGSDPAPPADCAIPDGEFDGIMVGTNNVQPFYGDRCSVSNTTVQVQKKQCMAHYCCEEPCICGGSNVKPEYMTCVNNTKPKAMLCFVLYTTIEQTLYGCCQGSEEDDFHVCSKAVNCAINNGGCDQLCEFNNRIGKYSCECYPGYNRRVINSAGTTQCIGNGTIPTFTPTTTTYFLMPSAASFVSLCGIPPPYIIAIVVGIILFLLLLLLLLLLALCLRRRARRAARVPAPSKAVVFAITGDMDGEKKPVKDFWVKVEDDDEKVKEETTGKGIDTNRAIENAYSEDPVENVAWKASGYSKNNIEYHDGYEGTYEEIPEKYEDNQAKYEEIPADYK